MKINCIHPVVANTIPYNIMSCWQVHFFVVVAYSVEQIHWMLNTCIPIDIQMVWDILVLNLFLYFFKYYLYVCIQVVLWLPVALVLRGWVFHSIAANWRQLNHFQLCFMNLTKNYIVYAKILYNLSMLPSYFIQVVHVVLHIEKKQILTNVKSFS